MQLFGGFTPQQTPLLVLAEGCFGQSSSKFALGIIRHGQWPIAAVIDSTQAGKTVAQIAPDLSCNAPIVDSLQSAMAYQPKALLLGTAPPGGGMPPEWFPVIEAAMAQGLHVISGLHDFLTERPDWVRLAKQHGVRLWDVRDPHAYGEKAFQTINLQQPRPKHTKVITTVGTDCSVGKMHTALALHHAAQAKQQCVSRFVATGQTGILIEGHGVPLDRIIGDFMAGAMADCIAQSIQTLPASNQEVLIWIEGQGSINHPAYSGVTLSLLHGSNPDAMILCHKASAETLRNYLQLPMPPLREWIHRYEIAAGWARPEGLKRATVVGLSINTSALSEAEAQAALHAAREESGLPVSDPVRFGVAPLLEAVLNA